MKCKYLALIFIIAFLLLSTIAAAGFWQYVTGMFSLSKFFKTKIAQQTIMPPGTCKISIDGECAKLACYNGGCKAGSERFNFLIITRTMFVKKDLNTFITWKNSKGFNVGLMTVDFIADNYAGENMGIKIRNAIQSMKDSNGVTFVLLIGDTGPINLVEGDENYREAAILSSYNLTIPWNVPAMYYDRLGTDKTALLPSDLPYTTAYSWITPPIVNPTTTELNFVARIYIGRWPLRTKEELKNVIQKTMTAPQIQNLQLTSDSSLYGPMSEHCRTWPPSDRFEFFCYDDIDNVVRTRVFEGRIPYTFSLTDVTNIEQAALARETILSANPDTAVIESFHGGHASLGFGHAYMTSGYSFTNVFSLFYSRSCNIGAYYDSDTDSLAESMVKSSTGPAVFVQPPTAYYFFENLLNGTSVGKAFYAGTDVYVYGPNPFYLFADPSLVLYKAGALNYLSFS